MHRLSTLLPFLLFVACDAPAYRPDGLRKLSHEELLERVEAGDVPGADVVIREPDGRAIPYDSAVARYAQAAWTTDTYVDDAGEPVELVLREVGADDLRYRAAVDAVYADWNANGRPVAILPVDCGESSATLADILRRDQGMRTDSTAVDPGVDEELLTEVVSLLEQCDEATLDGWVADDWSAAWAVVQHGSPRYRKQYLPLFRRVAAAGKLEPGMPALMEDRVLVDAGKPQRYGSQVRQAGGSPAWTLYELEDPGSVDRRRRAVGLGPLAEYLDGFGVPFTVEQER